MGPKCFPTTPLILTTLKIRCLLTQHTDEEIESQRSKLSCPAIPWGGSSTVSSSGDTSHVELTNISNLLCSTHNSEYLPSVASQVANTCLLTISLSRKKAWSRKMATNGGSGLEDSKEMRRSNQSHTILVSPTWKSMPMLRAEVSRLNT